LVQDRISRRLNQAIDEHRVLRACHERKELRPSCRSSLNQTGDQHIDAVTIWQLVSTVFESTYQDVGIPYRTEDRRKLTQIRTQGPTPGRIQ
jgi:hypothetical protein